MMAMARYSPSARASSRQMPPSGKKPSATDPTRGYANADGPGNTTNDYGPHRGGFTFDGLQSPRWDDRDPSRDMTPAMLAAEQAARQPMIDRRNELLAGNDAYQQAKAAGDLRGQIAAMTAMRGQMQQDRFVAQGGTPETWNTRFSNENNWPRPTSSIGYSHGPGRPDYATVGTNPSPYGPGNSAPPPSSGVRRGATPQANAPMSAGAPPSQNPMMQGYQSAYPQGGYMGGGAGVPTGSGWGSAGGMPGVPMGGGNPFASMGGGETGYMYDQPMMAAQGRTAPWQGLAPGSRQPVGPYTPQPLDPSQRGGMQDLMSLFNMQAGGLNASMFGGGNFGMPGGGPEGFMRFGGYQPAATQSMMYPY